MGLVVGETSAGSFASAGDGGAQRQGVTSTDHSHAKRVGMIKELQKLNQAFGQGTGAQSPRSGFLHMLLT